MNSFNITLACTLKDWRKLLDNAESKLGHNTINYYRDAGADCRD